MIWARGLSSFEASAYKEPCTCLPNGFATYIHRSTKICQKKSPYFILLFFSVDTDWQCETSAPSYPAHPRECVAVPSVLDGLVLYPSGRRLSAAIYSVPPLRIWTRDSNFPMPNSACCVLFFKWRGPNQLRPIEYPPQHSRFFFHVSNFSGHSIRLAL